MENDELWTLSYATSNVSTIGTYLAPLLYNFCTNFNNLLIWKIRSLNSGWPSNAKDVARFTASVVIFFFQTMDKMVRFWIYKIICVYVRFLNCSGKCTGKESTQQLFDVYLLHRWSPAVSLKTSIFNWTVYVCVSFRWTDFLIGTST